MSTLIQRHSCATYIFCLSRYLTASSTLNVTIFWSVAKFVPQKKPLFFSQRTQLSHRSHKIIKDRLYIFRKTCQFTLHFRVRNFTGQIYGYFSCMHSGLIILYRRYACMLDFFYLFMMNLQLKDIF